MDLVFTSNVCMGYNYRNDFINNWEDVIMIRKDFETKMQSEIYLAGEKIRMEKGYLTRSEREELKLYLGKPELLVKKIESAPGKEVSIPIITDKELLKRPSEKIVPGDNVKSIIQELKKAVANRPNSIGLSAPQIGYQKKISYIKVPFVNPKTNGLEYNEMILINPKIIEASKLFILKGEGCCSFPGIRIDTDRYIFITVEYLDENLKPQTYLSQDMEAFAIQHEVDHLSGILFFDRKHKAK